MSRTLVGLVVLGALGCGTGSAILEEPNQRPSERPTPSEEDALRTSARWDSLFTAAEQEFGVPAALLKAVAWSTSRYEMVTATPDFENAPQSFGLMGLGGDVLVKGAELARVSVESAKNDASSNVRAAAAWLNKQASTQGTNRAHISEWIPVLAGYSRIEDFQARQRFVKGDVFGALSAGVGALGDGLASQSMELQNAVGEMSTASQALLRAPDYEPAVWRPSPNFSARTAPVSMVIIHTCEGAYTGCYSWLQSTQANASAHYVVSSDGAEISQLVRETNKAWHISATYDCSRNGGTACELNGAATNNFSIGIEHGGFSAQSTWPAAQLDASAKLACAITQTHGIPRDRFHIVGHSQLQPWNRTDPGQAWPWTSYLEKVNASCGTPAAPSEITIDSNNANNNQSWGFVQLSANWRSSSNVPGYYGNGYFFADTAPVSDGAAFFFKLEADGERMIDAWWSAASDRATDATFVAFNAQGMRVGEGKVNQSLNGGQWNAVGRFSFSTGWNKIVLSRWSAAGKVVIADAVRVR